MIKSPVACLRRQKINGSVDLFVRNFCCTFRLGTPFHTEVPESGVGRVSELSIETFGGRHSNKRGDQQMAQPKKSTMISVLLYG
jgi:hypothetical protein